MALLLPWISILCWLPCFVANNAVAAPAPAPAPAPAEINVRYSGDSISTGATYTLGSVRYFAPPESQGKLNVPVALLNSSGPAAVQHIPLTIIAVDEPTFNASLLQQTVEHYGMQDDVFQEAFLKTIYVRYNGSGEPSNAGPSVNDVLQRYSSDLLLFSEQYASSENRVVECNQALPPGPYFLDVATGDVHRAYRLYSDVQQAFVSGLVERQKSHFGILPASVPGAESATIGVPSRLYFQRSPDLPLAGYRFGAKDIYDIAGVKTGCGSRAYYSLYPERNVTAPPIQMLLDAGAVLVGKMKTSQFANGEVATADWVDYHEPFNPRGDGEQDTQSSSAGPGAGTASYGWLDFAIGSDSGGSIRDPAGAQGIYGNRPSHGVVSLDHVMPLCSALDTPGIFARDADLWRSVAKEWFHDLQDYSEYPSKIIYPTEYFSIAAPSSPAGVLVEEFVRKLEGFLRVKREVISLDGLWNSTKPSSNLPSLDDFLYKTYSVLISVDQIKLLAKSFIADYGKVHDGREPFLDPSTEVRWAYGRSQPIDAFQEAMTNKTIFKDWFYSHLVGNDTKTCSNSLFIYPLTVGETVYRNTYLSPPVPPLGFSNVEVSIYTEGPDYVVPIGEIPYNSTITGKTEYLPVTVSLLAAKGCDLMLFNLIADLQKEGILKAVGTGTRL